MLTRRALSVAGSEAVGPYTLLRMKRGGSDKIDVYFAEKQARGFTFMSRRLFLASFLEVVERIDDTLEVMA